MSYYLTSSTSTFEFLAMLREHACNTGAPPAMIDKIDELAELPTEDEAAEQLEAVEKERDDMESNRDDLADALRDLVEALPESWLNEVMEKDDFGLYDSLRNAKQALSRSSGNSVDTL